MLRSRRNKRNISAAILECGYQWWIQDFPEGRPPLRNGENLLLGIIISENCKKIYKIGLRGTHVPFYNMCGYRRNLSPWVPSFTKWHLFYKRIRIERKRSICCSPPSLHLLPPPALPPSPPPRCSAPCFTAPLRLNQDGSVGGTNRHVLSARRFHYPTSCNTIRKKFPLK